MPSTVEQLSPTRVKLTIELPFADLKPHIDKAYREIGQQVNLPGFRKGKVPSAVIDQRFGRGMVLQEAINEALPEAYGQAVNEQQLVPLGQPEVEVTKLEDGEVVEFTAEVDVRPEFDLPDLSTVTAEVPALTVTEDDLNEQLDVLRQRFATNTEVDRPAGEGDLVTIDLAGSQDGEPLADASAEGVTYKVGSEGMLDGLDEAVTGLKAGESKKFTSELLGGPHKGEKADIEVTVHKVQEQTLPDVDDDFAQMVSEFDTADEMREDLRNGLTNYMRVEQANTARDKVLEDLISKVDFELPQNLIDAENDARRQQINAQLDQLGITLEQYLADAPDEEAETEDEFWETMEKRTSDALKAQVILDKLADDDEIGVDQQDLTQLLFRKAQENGTSPEQEAQHMMEHNHLPEWMQEVRRGKALTKIVQAATITDDAGEPVDLSKLNADGSIRDDSEPATEQADTATAETGTADTAETDDETKAGETPDAPDSDDADEAAPADKPAAPRKKRSDAAS